MTTSKTNQDVHDAINRIENLSMTHYSRPEFTTVYSLYEDLFKSMEPMDDNAYFDAFMNESSSLVQRFNAGCVEYRAYIAVHPNLICCIIPMLLVLSAYRFALAQMYVRAHQSGRSMQCLLNSVHTHFVNDI